MWNYHGELPQTWRVSSLETCLECRSLHPNHYVTVSASTVDLSATQKCSVWGSGRSLKATRGHWALRIWLVWLRIWIFSFSLMLKYLSRQIRLVTTAVSRIAALEKLSVGDLMQSTRKVLALSILGYTGISHSKEATALEIFWSWILIILCLQLTKFGSSESHQSLKVMCSLLCSVLCLIPCLFFHFQFLDHQSVACSYSSCK